MSLFEKEFVVVGKYGEVYKLSAKALYERVLKDSKSDYNWIASATELVNVCKDPSFPEMYAVAIKIIILNCFANLELKKEYPSRGEPTDAEAVCYCYNSLPAADETVKRVKGKYLTAVITGVTKYAQSGVRLPIHIGKTYDKKVEEWIMKKLNEYASAITIINFEQLRENLYADFEEMIKTAEKEGVFEKDDKEYREKLRAFWASIDLNNG